MIVATTTRGGQKYPKTELNRLTELSQTKINWTITLVIELNRYFKNSSLTEPNG